MGVSRYLRVGDKNVTKTHRKPKRCLLSTYIVVCEAGFLLLPSLVFTFLTENAHVSWYCAQCLYGTSVNFASDGQRRFLSCLQFSLLTLIKSGWPHHIWFHKFIAIFINIFHLSTSDVIDNRNALLNQTSWCVMLRVYFHSKWLISSKIDTGSLLNMRFTFKWIEYISTFQSKQTWAANYFC